MTDARRSHEQKTLADRQQYFETTIRGKMGPTVDESTRGIDSTGTTFAQTEREPTRTRTRPRKQKHHISDFFREHWVKAVGTVIMALLGWALSQIYNLNREVGQLQVQIGASGKDLSDARTEFQRFEDHVNQELDRTNDRLDRADHSHR